MLSLVTPVVSPGSGADVDVGAAVEGAAVLPVCAADGCVVVELDLLLEPPHATATSETTAIPTESPNRARFT